MRGGTLADVVAKSRRWGLSPHARGNRVLSPPQLLQAGPIPACAGEPRVCLVRCILFRAYPRMRGGTAGHKNFGFSTKGLSPHARGNPSAPRLLSCLPGPIPACAGEPVGHVAPLCGARAYPRMRGGTKLRLSDFGQVAGLSPHARGNLVVRVFDDLLQGPIPACAGEPLDHKQLI